MTDTTTSKDQTAVPQPAAAPLSASKVIVHPIVLLSCVDHYNRVAQNTKRRVVGVILGERKIDGVHVTNAFGVPFEEDARDPSIWFLDHNFLENMYAMFRKVNAREKILGWYHTGPKLRSADLDINELFRKYTKNPILVVVDPKPEHVGIPTEAYHVVEETKADGGTKKTFVHIPSAIGATEAEEIGVEHLLRDIKDMTVSSLGEQLAQKMTSLKGLHQRLNDIHSYLEKVAAGTLPVNNEIIFQLQDIFNLLPHLDVTELVKAFAVKTNDTMLVIYLSSIIRSVIALHNLVNNKIALKEAEKHEGSSKKEEKEEDAKASSADKDKGKEEGTSKK